MATKRLYRVVSTYAYSYSTGSGTYEVRRCFQSKRAAERQAQRRREGWTIESTGFFDDEDFVQEPALSVRIDVSLPVVFPVDVLEEDEDGGV